MVIISVYYIPGETHTMALAKDSFFQEPLTEDQERTVNEVETMIDHELTQRYIGAEVCVRVQQLDEISEDQCHDRCKFEILRRYQAAGWNFYWYEDSRDGDLHAVLK